MPLSGPIGVALVLIYPCGKAWNSPQEGALKEGRRTYEMAVAPVGKNPLSPLPWMIPDRSSPSRVRFAASRPGRLRADPGDALFRRGKGGSGRGAQGRVAKRMIKDIIMHIWGEAERELSAIPAA